MSANALHTFESSEKERIHNNMCSADGEALGQVDVNTKSLLISDFYAIFIMMLAGIFFVFVASPAWKLFRKIECDHVPKSLRFHVRCGHCHGAQSVMDRAVLQM